MQNEIHTDINSGIVDAIQILDKSTKKVFQNYHAEIQAYREQQARSQMLGYYVLGQVPLRIRILSCLMS